MWLFMERCMFFFNSSELAYGKQREPITMWKNPHCRKHSFQKLTQLSQGNNVLDTADSNINGFLWRDTCVSSTQVRRPFWNPMCLSLP
jgi:hypothetical protein